MTDVAPAADCRGVGDRTDTSRRPRASAASEAGDLLRARAGAGPCEVEIGCGNGHFIVSYAARRPGTLLIGIDIKARRCRRAREKAEKRGLGNVQIVHGAAEQLLRDLPPCSVDAFHIYFPDPWPKSRHRKRRFFTMETLRAIHGRLRGGGRVYFGTDFFDYYLQAKVLLALHGGFRLGEDAPEDVLTSIFGQRFVEARKTIRIFSAIRLPLPDDQGEKEKDEGKIHESVQRDEQH
ncbi:MAG: tRNA (guanine(46)-N(7))-methyltransferase TrmB [Spirochaetia bacterium]